MCMSLAGIKMQNCVNEFPWPLHSRHRYHTTEAKRMSKALVHSLLAILNIYEVDAKPVRLQQRDNPYNMYYIYINTRISIHLKYTVYIERNMSA